MISCLIILFNMNHNKPIERLYFNICIVCNPINCGSYRKGLLPPNAKLSWSLSNLSHKVNIYTKFRLLKALPNVALWNYSIIRLIFRILFTPISGKVFITDMDDGQKVINLITNQCILYRLFLYFNYAGTALENVIRNIKFIFKNVFILIILSYWFYILF